MERMTISAPAERELPVLLAEPPVSSFRRWLAPVVFDNLKSVK